MKPILYFTKQLHTYAGRVLYFNLLGMVFISFFEGIGIFLLIPMINMSGILKVNTDTIPIIGNLHFLQNLPKNLGLPFILAVYILLVVGQAVLKRNFTIRNAKINIGFINHLRLVTYRALLQANWLFFIKKRKSDLIKLLTSDMGRVTGGTHLFLQFLSSLVFTFIQIGLAFWLSPEITAFVLFWGILLAFFSRKFIKKSQALGNQTTETAQNYMAGITDHFNGMKDIKSNRLEESRYHWLRSWSDTVLEQRLGYVKVKTASNLFYKLASAILIVILIYLTVKLFRGQSGQLLVIILIFSRLWPRFSGIQSSLEQIAASIPAFETLIEIREECNASSEMKSGEINDEETKPILLEKGLECRHVSFRYHLNQPAYALKDINLHIPANRMTAIVGRSGAGKSTLIDILMGLMQPERGQVLVDEAPLSGDTLFSLRRSISYVAQDPFLFSSSIRENLLLVEPDAKDEELWEAVEFSQSAEFVSRLPNGLDTVIGDRGVRLSGGERQRLVLARAILRKPSILVLDEATSALDTENEARIQKAVEGIRGKMTIIVIAHRLSTIRHADQVIVLDQGKVIQKGGFNQLASEKRGVFSHLLENQLEVSQ